MQKANCGSVGWNGAETGRLEPSLFPAPGVCIRFQTKGSQWVRAAQESRNGKAGPPVPVSSELKRSFLNRELIRFKYVACVDLRRRHSRGRLCLRLRSDRKSTRLNSSHSQISYAVFCLYKKRWR